VAERSAADGVVKLGLGIGVGFGLYLLIQNLGFGRGFGLGGGRGEARSDDAPAPPPPMRRDEQRLEFLMVGPTTLDNKTASFRGPGGQIFTLDEMIARIKAGGRMDVTLKVRGDVIAGPADTAEAQIKRAGIDLWKPAPPPLFPEKRPAGTTPDPVKVSGNIRGQYGRGYYRGVR
jgi:hypothetical protein